jgi:hypothetical protein
MPAGFGLRLTSLGQRPGLTHQHGAAGAQELLHLFDFIHVFEGGTNAAICFVISSVVPAGRGGTLKARQQWRTT